MDASPSPRLLTELTRGQSLRLLASVRLGRIVFTHRALPAIRPVNHLLDGEDEVIRTHPGAAIVVDTGPASGVVVAYEADAIDPGTGLGWSVIVTGIARQVTSHDDVARYEQPGRRVARGVHRPGPQQGQPQPRRHRRYLIRTRRGPPGRARPDRAGKARPVRPASGQ